MLARSTGPLDLASPSREGSPMFSSVYRKLLRLTVVVASCLLSIACAEESNGDIAPGPAPLSATISDAVATELHGGIRLQRLADDSAEVLLSLGSGDPVRLTTGVNLGRDGARLVQLLNGETVEMSESNVHYTLSDGSEVTRPVQSVALNGSLESNGTLTVTLGPDQVGISSSASATAELTITGKFNVECYCSDSSSGGDPDVGTCADIESWCSQKRALFGL